MVRLVQLQNICNKHTGSIKQLSDSSVKTHVHKHTFFQAVNVSGRRRQLVYIFKLVFSPIIFSVNDGNRSRRYGASMAHCDFYVFCFNVVLFCYFISVLLG